MRRVQGNDVGILLTSPYGKVTWNSLATEQGVDIGGGVPETYVVSFLWVLKLVDFPVDECPERVKNQGRLREHFIYRHWG